MVTSDSFRAQFRAPFRILDVSGPKAATVRRYESAKILIRCCSIEQATASADSCQESARRNARMPSLFFTLKNCVVLKSCTYEQALKIDAGIAEESCQLAVDFGVPFLCLKCGKAS